MEDSCRPSQLTSLGTVQELMKVYSCEHFYILRQHKNN